MDVVDNPPKIYIKNIQRSASRISVSFLEAMGRLSCDVDQHSRNIANKKGQ
jgi:hypothetical protein